jgi:hypothetical protein
MATIVVLEDDGDQESVNDMALGFVATIVTAEVRGNYTACAPSRHGQWCPCNNFKKKKNNKNKNEQRLSCVVALVVGGTCGRQQS